MGALCIQMDILETLQFVTSHSLQLQSDCKEIKKHQKKET